MSFNYAVSFGIISFLFLMHTSINFYHQFQFITVKIRNETINDLLSSEMQSI